MPLPKKERICKSCDNFHTERGWENGECRKNPPVSDLQFRRVHKTDWCADGYWSKFSDITNRVESYAWDDDLSWREEQYRGDKETLYILTFTNEKGGDDCELFKHHEDMRRNYVRCAPANRRVFLATYDSTDEWWWVKPFEVEE